VQPPGKKRTQRTGTENQCLHDSSSSIASWNEKPFPASLTLSRLSVPHQNAADNVWEPPTSQSRNLNEIDPCRSTRVATHQWPLPPAGLRPAGGGRDPTALRRPWLTRQPHLSFCEHPRCPAWPARLACESQPRAQAAQRAWSRAPLWVEESAPGPRGCAAVSPLPRVRGQREASVPPYPLSPLGRGLGWGALITAPSPTTSLSHSECAFLVGAQGPQRPQWRLTDPDQRQFTGRLSSAVHQAPSRDDRHAPLSLQLTSRQPIGSPRTHWTPRWRNRIHTGGRCYSPRRCEHQGWTSCRRGWWERLSRATDLARNRPAPRRGASIWS